MMHMITSFLFLLLQLFSRVTLQTVIIFAGALSVIYFITIKKYFAIVIRQLLSIDISLKLSGVFEKNNSY